LQQQVAQLPCCLQWLDALEEEAPQLVPGCVGQILVVEIASLVGQGLQAVSQGGRKGLERRLVQCEGPEELHVKDEAFRGALEPAHRVVEGGQCVEAAVDLDDWELGGIET